jgi:hypothetical protein
MALTVQQTQLYTSEEHYLDRDSSPEKKKKQKNDCFFITNILMSIYKNNSFTWKNKL